MLFDFFTNRQENKILDFNKKRLKDINALKRKYEKMPQSEMIDFINNCRSLFNGKERKKCYGSVEYEQTLVNVFACVREASKRAIDQFHYDKQILAALCLVDNCIIEMRTGEGKTLTCVPAACFKSLFGFGVHVVTANDYLARRDYEWMGKIFEFIGVEIGCVTGETKQNERKAQYAKAVTYTTNTEVGFDYLRDNMKYRAEDICMRGFHELIADEVDHLLIDCARVPYILSNANYDEDQIAMWRKIDRVVKMLSAPLHVQIDLKQKAIYLTNQGYDLLEAECKKEGFKNIYVGKDAACWHYIDKCLKANFIMVRDKDYIVGDNVIYVVDEFTGRVCKNRKFSDGLHNAIEAKEDINITPSSSAAASITVPSLFRKYEYLCGLTGTAFTDRVEFQSVYNTAVVRIDRTDKKNLKRHSPLFFATRAMKFAHMARVVKERHETGQPILIGTNSIVDSESFSDYLTALGVKHHVLNATRHELEAKIIASAGKPNSVTIATNMAGRGTDIKLGGDPEFEIMLEGIADPEEKQRKFETCHMLMEQVIKLGGLLVMIGGISESIRIENQLEGRTARKGDIGEVMRFFSCEDSIVKPFVSPSLVRQMQRMENHDHGIDSAFFFKAFRTIQSTVENNNYELRKNLLNLDLVVDSKRNKFYEVRLATLTTDLKKQFNAHFNELIAPMDVYRTKNRSVVLHELKTRFGVEAAHILDDVSLDSILEKIKEDKQTIMREMLDDGALNRDIIINVLVKMDEFWRDFNALVDCIRTMAYFKTLKNRNLLIEFSLDITRFFEMLILRFKGAFVTTVFRAFDMKKKSRNLNAHELELIANQHLIDPKALEMIKDGLTGN